MPVKCRHSYIHSYNAQLTTPVDGAIYFVGAGVVSTAANEDRIVIIRPGVVTSAVLLLHATTVGTNENIVLALRLNDTTDYAIATVGLAQADRLFANYSMNVPVKRGDTLQFKMTCPTWATNPVTLTFNQALEVTV